MKLSANRRFAILFYPGFLLLLISCHSEYLNLSCDFDNQFAWESDNSGFAFSAISSLYRKPEGIATFPDGGRVKYEYYNAVLYSYNIKENNLKRVVDFKDLLPLYKKVQLLNTQLVFTDSLLYYKLSKPYDIEIRSTLKRSQNNEDSLKVFALVERASKAYACNKHTNEITEVDSATFNSAMRQKKVDKNLRQLALDYLSKLSYADFGILLQDIYPQSKETYIKYIVHMEGNTRTREAIFEQIIPGFTKKEIGRMLEDMDTYKARIDNKSKSSLKYKDKLSAENYDKYYESVRKRLLEFL
jgi:hypothetical protein